MKKYFILLLVLCFNSFGYEYLIYTRLITEGLPPDYARELFYSSQDGTLMMKRIQINNSVVYQSKNSSWYNYLNSISHNIHNQTELYINKNDFDNTLRTDLVFLNDFFIQAPNYILNYLYNNSFNSTNYIEYNDYKLLYDINGYAVESIVDGVWAGLYSDSERSVSGALYSSGGQMLYYNGKSVTWLEGKLYEFTDMVSNSLVESWRVLSYSVKYVVSAVFVLAILWFVVWASRSSVFRKKGV